MRFHLLKTSVTISIELILAGHSLMNFYQLRNSRFDILFWYSAFRGVGYYLHLVFEWIFIICPIENNGCIAVTEGVSITGKHWMLNDLGMKLSESSGTYIKLH